MGQKQTVLEKRYFRGTEKTESDLFRRVADFLGNDEDERTKFYNEMSSHRFMPNTPCLVNAGVEESSGQLFACFVLPIEDSMECIFDTLKHTALIHKTGGGTGFNFSRIRPKDARVRSSNGVASGPITFMQAYDASTETVKQGGVRRGANMACFSIHHPNIKEFIVCKDDLSSLQNFNISVALDSKFMEAAKAGKDWEFSFNGENLGVGANARDLLNMIVEQAWKNGEPGILFLDRINEKHPLPELIESTNPCGEQPLLPYESCCLGSINLASFVRSDRSFDMEAFEHTVTIGIEFLNRMLDKNIYPIPQIKEISERNRKVGLGVMGYADMLIKMGYVYGTDEALSITDGIASNFQNFAHQASIRLSYRDGPFPSFQTSTYDEPHRNATVTTIAPTGTISIIAEASSGIEPIFAPMYISRSVDSAFAEIHPLFERMLKEKGTYDAFQKQASDSQRTRGPNDPIIKEPDIKDYLPEIADYIAVTHDVTPEQHIKTQAVWQKYTDNAVSKTINLPNSATREDVYNSYMLAYELGCKGLTVYRDGSRYLQPLSTMGAAEVKKLGRGDIVPSDDKAVGRKRKLRTGCGNLHCQAWFDRETGALHEVFLSKGSTGGCNSYMSGLSRMISLAARAGCNINQIVEQLESSLECASYVSRRASHGDTSRGKSCPTAVAKVLVELYNEIQSELGLDSKADIAVELGEGCIQCGAPVKHESGCTTCTDCGYSSCG